MINLYNKVEANFIGIELQPPSNDLAPLISSICHGAIGKQHQFSKGSESVTTDFMMAISLAIRSV